MIKVGDIIKNVELYPNELKKKELSVIVQGLREKGLEYLLKRTSCTNTMEKRKR